MVTNTTKRFDINELKSQLVPILKRHQVSRAGIFGSIATGTADNTSDLDLVIEFQGEKTLLDLVALKLDLEEAIHLTVDLLTYKSLNPLIKDKVLNQEIRVF